MITNRIKELRTKNKMTQKELGDCLGLSQSHIAMLEKGERSLDIELMADISKVLKVKPYELLPTEWQPDEISPEEREILQVIRKTTTSQNSDYSNIPPQTNSQTNTSQSLQPPLKSNKNER